MSDATGVKGLNTSDDSRASLRLKPEDAEIVRRHLKPGQTVSDVLRAGLHALDAWGAAARAWDDHTLVQEVRRRTGLGTGPAILAALDLFQDLPSQLTDVERAALRSFLARKKLPKEKALPIMIRLLVNRVFLPRFAMLEIDLDRYVQEMEDRHPFGNGPPASNTTPTSGDG